MSDCAYLATQLFCDERHLAEDELHEANDNCQIISTKWRQRGKLKTSAVALVVCLNIGVDPPDAIKISPCARMQCWVDPSQMQPQKALETIGKCLQQQYERWQPRAKYRYKLDPTTEDVRNLCASCRKTVKNERVLFHYNGHGVPRPTQSGEIWVFNRHITQYIPLSIFDVHSWLQQPCIYVLDCSNAGVIVKAIKAFVEHRQRETSAKGVDDGTDPMKEVIMLAACGPCEVLPQNPEFPADVFTSCLTTPLKMALRWFISRRMLRTDGLTKELIDRIPGKLADRKTPLGELNWIFTAITDTIAWNMLPRALFQKLFRQDLLVASLFRNFLLAERIMVASGCTPITLPRLPPTHQHPLWQAWDSAAEMCLLQMPKLASCSDDNSVLDSYEPTNFFSEQLTAFELWLQHGSEHNKPPEQLPIVLQVLLSQVHRLRALELLARFLDMGSWAVDLALSVGIFPYVLKLLHTTSAELRQTLVFIWTKILALDSSCQQDLIKDNGYLYFMRLLKSHTEPSADDAAQVPLPCSTLAQAAFVLATICDGHERGQELCFDAGLLTTCINLLQHPSDGMDAAAVQLHKWSCLCVGKLCEGNPRITAAAMSMQVQKLLEAASHSPAAEVRAAAVYALGAMVYMPGSGPAGAKLAIDDQEQSKHEQGYLRHLMCCVYDGSPLVRAEVVVAMGRIAAAHLLLFQEALSNCRNQLQQNAKRWKAAGPGSMYDATQSAPSSPRHGSVGSAVYLAPAIDRSASMMSAVERRACVSDGHLLEGPSGFDDFRRALRSQSPPLLNRHTLPAHSNSSVHSGSALADAGFKNDGSLAGQIVAATAEVLSGKPPPPDPSLESIRDNFAETSTSGSHAPAKDGLADSSQHAASGDAIVGVNGDVLTSNPDGSSLPPSPIPSPPPPTAAAAAHQADMMLLACNADAQSFCGGSRYSGSEIDGSSVTGTAASIYDFLVNCICLLATDPSPKVASPGRAVLRMSKHEIKHLLPQPAASQPPTAQTGPSGLQSNSNSPSVKDEFSLGPTRRQRSFQLPWMMRKPLRSLTSIPSSLSSASHANPTPPPHPNSPAQSVPSSPRLRDTVQPLTIRTPFILTRISSGDPHHGGESASAIAKQLIRSECAGSERSASVASPCSSGATTPTAYHQTPHVQQHAALATGIQALPKSLVYHASASRFSHPMLEPAASAMLHAKQSAAEEQLSGWCSVPRIVKQSERFKNIKLWLDRHRNLSSVRYLDQPVSFKTHADYTMAACMHTYEPMIVTADHLGHLHVFSHRNSKSVVALNAFHIATGAAFAPLTGRSDEASSAVANMSSTTALYVINETHNAMIMACAADGAVRVWKNVSFAGQQRMATAFQSVSVDTSNVTLPPPPTVYHWSPLMQKVYSAGGSAAGNIHIWDVDSEQLVQQIYLDLGPGLNGNCANSSRLHCRFLDGASVASPHTLLASRSDGLLLVYDLRTANATPLSIRPHAYEAPIGLAYEPGCRENVLVSGTASGTLVFMDLRMCGHNNGHDDAVVEVKAEGSSAMTCLAAHPNTPVVATANAKQVVKLWSATGEHYDTQQPSVVRSASSHAPYVAPATCLSFHPYELQLVMGSKDALCTLLRMQATATPPDEHTVHSAASSSDLYAA